MSPIAHTAVRPRRFAPPLPRLFRRGLRPGRLLRSLLGAVAVLWLVQLHLVLLWERVDSRTLLEPPVILRWVVAVLLGVAWLRLRRMDRSPDRRRQVLVFWLLVVLLHASAAVPVGDGRAPAVLTESSLLLALPLWASLAPALWLAIGVTLGRGRRVQRAYIRPPFLSRFAVASRLALRPGFAPAYASRPPPV